MSNAITITQNPNKTRRLLTNLEPQPNLSKAALFIAQTQTSSGAIPWFEGGKLDPWDHTEAAMGLSIGGYYCEAEAAYEWLMAQQLDDGSWRASYFAKAEHTLRETNFIAYIATGVWHHYLITGNKQFLTKLFPCVAKAINFVLRHQTNHGDIAWAVNEDNTAQDDALVTACSSILRSLECAIYCAQALGASRSRWLTAGQKLRHTLLRKPFRFDRTWDSKARFAMDWYYPILTGILTRAEAQQRLQSRWHEFVKPTLGCRCVSDEPWVTVAESSELVIALLAADKTEQARGLFEALLQWRAPNGGYWTGYVYESEALWPDEVTTWTAGAVLLAADALFGYTKARNLFTSSSIF